MSTDAAELPSLRREVTQERIAAYADVSGDHNPIHLDAAFAAGSQFGRIVAHGMLLYGFLSDAMRRAYPGSWEASGAMRARFRVPARPGDVVTVTGSLIRRIAEPDENSTVRYSLECRNAAGEVLATGTAEVTIASDESSAGEPDDRVGGA